MVLVFFPMAWGNSCGDFSRMVDLNYTNLLRFVFSLQYNDKLEYYTLCTYTTTSQETQNGGKEAWNHKSWKPVT